MTAFKIGDRVTARGEEHLGELEVAGEEMWGVIPLRGGGRTYFADSRILERVVDKDIFSLKVGDFVMSTTVGQVRGIANGIASVHWSDSRMPEYQDEDNLECVNDLVDEVVEYVPRRGDQVTITEGPAAGLTGVVTSVSGGGVHIRAVGLFQGATGPFVHYVSVNKANVRPTPGHPAGYA